MGGMGVLCESLENMKNGVVIDTRIMYNKKENQTNILNRRNQKGE